jgi:hypothetical protein
MVESKINVFIDGDKSNFISKLSINKFKQKVKQSDFQLDDLNNISSLYLKPKYLFHFISHENNDYKFEIIKKPKDFDKPKPKPTVEGEVDDKTKLRELMRSKINIMTKNRTNHDYHKAKLSGKVDDEILEEYNKLKKVSKIHVPDPYEVINDPEQYKPIISMVLNNDIMNTLGKTHSYVKYFTLLANKIGATPMLNPPTAPIPTQDFTNNTAQLPANFNDIVKMAGPSQDPVISEEIPRVVLALPSQDPINENITKSNSDTEED